ncbi:hypothetical protein Ddc_14672 [Ditylenchus destructor]|nr:hypothetical protein Ddc_14672 [Ditylenchus destructor]
MTVFRYIFLFALCFFGIFETSATTEEHSNENPADKYKAEFNEQSSQNQDTEAAKDQAAVNLAEKLLLTGKDALTIGDYKRALWCFDESYKYQPLNPENLAARAYCHLKMESYALAFVDAEETLKVDLDNKSAMKTKVLAMIGLQRRPEAIIHHIEKINDTQLTDKYKNVTAQTELNSEDKPLMLDEILQEAKSNFDSKNFQAALALYNKVLPHLAYGSKLYMDALKNRMGSLSNLRRMAESYVDATELLELATDEQFEYHSMRGMFLLNLERANEAVAEFDKVIELDPDENRAEHIKGLMAKLRADLVRQENLRKRQLILDSASSGIPPAESKIAELIIGPTYFMPNNFITVKAADGKKYEAKTFAVLIGLLSPYKYQITRVTFSGIVFDHEFIHVLTSVDNVLWTGIFRMESCDFTKLSENEILDLFRNTLKPESLSLIQNSGLTSDILNKAIKEHLLDCSLAIIGDDTDELRLNPEELVEFLHRPARRALAVLTINPKFIDGGVINFVEKIVERFHSDATPVSFHLQLTKVIDLPLLSDTPLENTRTNELLSKEILEVVSVRQTILKRYRKKG